MFKSNNAPLKSLATAAWPAARIVGALDRQFQSVEMIGEEQGFALYAVSDHGVNFVVALAQGPGAAGSVAEIGFLARFVGFGACAAAVEDINRNLHLSIASLEGDGDLYVLAGVEVTGVFDEGQFKLLLETWKRDLLIVLHGLSGDSAMASAFAFAGGRAAQSFAINRAPDAGAGEQADVLKSFLAARSMKAVCDDCGGRGRRGLIARPCETCEGAGFVADRRARH